MEDKNNIPGKIGVAFVALFVATGVFVGLSAQKEPSKVETMTSVFIDVNPSLELIVDDEGMIEEIKALNEDAENLLLQYEEESKDLNSTIKALTDLLIENNYLNDDETPILITTQNEDLEEALELSDEVEEMVRVRLEEKDKIASILSQAMTQKDKSEQGGENLSLRKQLFVDGLVAANPQLDGEQLKTMSLGQMVRLSKESGVDVRAVIDEVKEERKELRETLKEEKKEGIVNRIKEALETRKEKRAENRNNKEKEVEVEDDESDDNEVEDDEVEGPEAEDEEEEGDE